MKKKNPVLEKKFEQGYKKGFENGKRAGKMLAVTHLKHKVNTLDKIEGIGEKTKEKIIRHFGIDFDKLIK